MSSPQSKNNGHVLFGAWEWIERMIGRAAAIVVGCGAIYTAMALFIEPLQSPLARFFFGDVSTVYVMPTALIAVLKRTDNELCPANSHLDLSQFVSNPKNIIYCTIGAQRYCAKNGFKSGFVSDWSTEEKRSGLQVTCVGRLKFVSTI